jgi:flagellar biosynthetic protein FliQ
MRGRRPKRSRDRIVQRQGTRNVYEACTVDIRRSLIEACIENDKGVSRAIGRSPLATHENKPWAGKRCKRSHLKGRVMSSGHAIDLVREALMLMLSLSFPILLAALVIGLVVSILQAVTQVQEQTLSFVPKIVGMGITAVLVFPWMAKKIVDFAVAMFSGQ